MMNQMHHSLDYHVNYAWEAYLTKETKKEERRRRREREEGPISTHDRASEGCKPVTMRYGYVLLTEQRVEDVEYTGVLIQSGRIR